jgi:hypothetical protein
MTPELETELWSKVAAWVCKGSTRHVSFLFERGAYCFSASNAGEAVCDASAPAYVDALRRFVGKLQGNRS